MLLDSRVTESFKRVITKSTWDLSLLVGSEKTQFRFDKEFAKVFNGFESDDLDQLWNCLCASACEAASIILRRPALPRDPVVRSAYAELQRQLHLFNQRRIVDIDATYDLVSDFPPILLPDGFSGIRQARRSYLSAIKMLRVRRLCVMLDSAEEMVHIGERTHLAMKFIKKIRRAPSSTASQIGLSLWHQDLQKVQGESVPLVEELDHFPLKRPPTFSDMSEVLDRMKNGKAPGLDLLSAEMIKSSPALSLAVYDVVSRAYLHNQVPLAWQTTVSHPIPKKGAPKTVDDYRKITLCSVGYKLYIGLIHQQLNQHLPRIQDYQSGFLPNRSCDDQTFVIGRVMEERWNHNLPTYLMELDYRKAFDLVKISQLPSILSQHGVPQFLVNRIILACLHEKNCVSWLGERTAVINKSLGIKQGCPMSPLLFNVILDCAVNRLSALLMNQNIDLFIGEADKPLTLPMLLAYADDTSILACDLLEFVPILETFIPILSDYGLGINVNKSGFLVKDPTRLLVAPPHLDVIVPDPVSQQSTIYRFPQVKSVTVLGVAVNSTMHRKDSIRARCVLRLVLFASLSHCCPISEICIFRCPC